MIVEPGAREQPGTIVVTRSRHGVSLKRVASHSLRTPARDRRMPTVLELPLREQSAESFEHVVGSVLGLLRATGTGALRPVPLHASRAPKVALRADTPPRERETEQALQRDAERFSPEMLERVHERWRTWLARERESAREPVAEDLERWDRLDASLTALCECLSRTHNPELRGALIAEASSVVSDVTAEIRRYSNYPLLQ